MGRSLMGRKPECGGAQEVREPPNAAEHMEVRERPAEHTNVRELLMGRSPNASGAHGCARAAPSFDARSHLALASSP